MFDIIQNTISNNVIIGYNSCRVVENIVDISFDFKS